MDIAPVNGGITSKRKSDVKSFVLLASILVLVVGLLTTFIFSRQPLKSNLNEKATTESFRPKKAKQQIGDVGVVKQQSEIMVQFIDQTLNLNLDDFVTIEQSAISLRELLKFNNVHLSPRISSIVKMDPFKFVKFNLKRTCKLWPDIFSCTKIGCNIKFCDRSELPKSYLELDQNESDDDDCPKNSPKALSQLDQTLSKGNVETLNDLFQCSPDDSDDSEYYDLIRNPERYTGYDGCQIWKAIYEENCFPNEKGRNIFSSLDQRCYEERVFYRSISGLHSSITTHLTSLYHISNNHFGPNADEYFKRFNGHSAYIKNLFFIYLIELRALYKSHPYLLEKIKWKTVDDKAEIRDAIRDLLKTERLFKWHFNENVLFTHDTKPLAQQLAAHFHNITFNIMDCVSCDKCRLWGKVQTHGLGTAFKILLTKDINQLRLSHHEITCLLNALARLSHSIAQIENFYNIYTERILNPSVIKKKLLKANDKGFLNYL
ncbi:oxidoreductase [Blomia tropicalis]|nr:oxidoreductase [Blomia tropicalis]